MENISSSSGYVHLYTNAEKFIAQPYHTIQKGITYIMRKLIVLLTALGLTLGLMTGCGESTPLLSATDYELDQDTKVTSRDITIGDNAESFLTAYGDYKIFTSVEGGDYQVYATEEIPFDSSITLLLPTFFIDGLPADLDQFCEENEIGKSELTAVLNSDDFLNSHTVVYYYLLFSWENGVITDIRSEYMDYNEDAAYYKKINS